MQNFKNINLIQPIPENYNRLVRFIETTASIAISREHRKIYTPDWIKLGEALLYKYKYNHHRNEVPENQMYDHTATEEMDFTHFNRNPWTLLRNLGAAQPTLKSILICIKFNALLVTFLKHLISWNYDKKTV